MMMRRIGLLIGLFVLVCFSCDKKAEEPKYSGEVLLSSEPLQSGQDYAFYGFSFETGLVSIYKGSNTRPDLTCNHIIITTEIESVYLESSDDEQAFFKNGTFANASKAEEFFNSYSEVASTQFLPLAENITVNQVWTVQTESKHFAKIWIKEITYQTGSLSEFANIKFQYQYQPDGTGTFDCNCD